jgi:hypothetical protein
MQKRDANYCRGKNRLSHGLNKLSAPSQFDEEKTTS